MFLTLLQSQGTGPSPVVIADTSDILVKPLFLTNQQEEILAAQILKQRYKQERKKLKKEINWQKKLLAKINGVETVEELDAIAIQIEDVSITTKVLEIVQRAKEAKRLELLIANAEAKIRILEVKAEAETQEAQYVKALNDQRAALSKAKQIQEIVLNRHELAIKNAITAEKEALLNAKAMQEQLIARHDIALQKAIETEKLAFLQHYEAEQKAIEFTRKRNNRIKRLKALMWLAKLDI